MSSNILSTSVATKNKLDEERPRQVKVIRAPSLSFTRLYNDLVVLAQYRDLLYTLTAHRIKVRYKQSVLGIFWAVLQPLSLMLIYTVVFSWFARMPSDGVPYTVFAYTALMLWSSFSTALINATNGLVSHTSLVTKVYFPREILPLTYVFAAVFDMVIASIVLEGLLIYYDISLTLKAFYVIPIILILTVFTTSIAFIFSAIQVRFRDVGVGMPLLMQLWMFASPVVYSLKSVPEKWHTLFMLNPMVGILENFRGVILHGTLPNFRSLIVAAVISLILLPISYIYFKHAEATIADII
jgi:lipopolysaccharide transport system permease protein